MKKVLAAAATAAALWLGAGASAADLTLPNGIILPFADEVEVHAGSDSYFSKHINDRLGDPKVKEKIASYLEGSGLEKDASKEDIEKLSQFLAETLRDSRVYQLRAKESGPKAEQFINMPHVAYVLALQISEEELSREEIEAYLKAFDAWDAFRGGLRAGTRRASPGFAEGLKISEAIKKARKEAVSGGGIAYRSGSLFAAPETEGIREPAFLYVFDAEKDGKSVLLLLYANQTAGRYFETVLKQAEEAAK